MHSHLEPAFVVSCTGGDGGGCSVDVHRHCVTPTRVIDSSVVVMKSTSVVVVVVKMKNVSYVYKQLNRKRNVPIRPRRCD
jgi:hypothetical protein